MKLLSLNDVDESWHVSFDKCLGLCLSKNRRTRPGMVLWDGNLGLDVEGMGMVAFTGKCDVCHNFHVWCWACGEKFALQREETYACNCGYSWCSIIELEDVEGQHQAVHLLMHTERQIFFLDRYMLR